MIKNMPEDLDPTTARLVSELAAVITPSLTKSLNSAIHTDDFINAVDHTNMISQDLKNQIEKSIRSSVDDNRAARSMMMQSMRNVFDELASLRKTLDKVPDVIDFAIKNNTPEENINNNSEVLTELARVSELINELIEGIRNLSEVYVRGMEEKNSESELKNNFESYNEENSTRLEKLLNTSLPGLEGLVKAHEKSQSRELEEFSKEISALHKENDKTIIFKIKEALNNELEKNSEEIVSKFEGELEARDKKISLLLKIILGISGVSLILSLIKIFI